MLSNNIKVIIVEDERASQLYLIQLLSLHFPEISIVSIEDIVMPAIQAIDSHKPDIVFMDVEIRKGTGFDVLAGVEDIAFDVIFTTAFNKFAIDAFQYHAVDYLLKPLADEKVIKAVQHCIAKKELQRSGQQITQLLHYLQKSHLQRLPVCTMHGLEFIDIEDILYAEASGNYCKLNLRSGIIILTTKKIKELAEQLPNPRFIRIHHSYIVHSRYIKQYHKGRGGYVVLDDGTSLPVSPLKKNDFLKHFT